MKGLLQELLKMKELQELMTHLQNRQGPALVTGVSPVQRAQLAAAAAQQLQRPLLMLCADEAECRAAVKSLEDIFGFAADEHKGAIFAGTQFEVMKAPGRGTKGHIAISTNFVDRAEAYLSRMGVEFIDETRGFDAKGKETVVYLKEEIGGFAFHLVKK